jgi:hypothetical protein
MGGQTLTIAAIALQDIPDLEEVGKALFSFLLATIVFSISFISGIHTQYLGL